MTKYVLNSGGIRNNPAKAKEFTAEILKGLSPKPKMLLALFAVPREDWAQKFADFDDQLKIRMPKGVNVELELATPDQFEEQVKNNDIIFLQGGDDDLITYRLSRYQDLAALFKGKVVAASSAGSDVLATHYWTCDWRKLMDGLGILPIKFLPHFNSAYGADDTRGPVNWAQGYKDLEAYGDTSLPIHALEEGHFVVVEVE